MKVSLNVIKKYIDFELPPVDELVARINAKLGGVEEVIDLGQKYMHAKIVKVVECEKHPNADKLSVCKVDDGTGESIQVVCGALNVHADMWAVWLPPQSVVPSTFNDAEPFILDAREIRGQMSNGMLASAKELGISDDHNGIVEIFETDVPDGKSLMAGSSFAEVFGLDDTIIDIENKMFTHRPDLFGQLGVAREVAGIFGKQFKSPEWYVNTPDFGQIDDGELKLEVFNDASGRVPRFMAVATKNIEVKPSPLWLQCALVAMGSKPINNIVDATNYAMLITAQPTHAYDYDKLRGQCLGARMAHDGENVTLLNGKNYALTPEDIVIADGEGAIGLAGIMGGSNSEVSSDTKNIVLEVANFDMYAVRKSSMRHGIFTDALTRFNKGQSPFQNDYVLRFLVESVSQVSSGVQASDIFDLGHYNDDCIFVFTEDPDFHKHSFAPQGVTKTFINDRLGLKLEKDEIVALLKNVEFKVNVDEKGLDVHYPFWRTDIQDPEDIVEEVGRLYGYDRLPRELPKRRAKPVKLNSLRQLAQQIRTELARAGANEVVTYSFVHERVLKSAGQNTDDAYKLSNALSPDLQFYRMSLTPSLLDKVHQNIKSGYDEFALFEIGKGHSKVLGFNEEGLPKESTQLALVYACKEQNEGAPFYYAKSLLEFVAAGLDLDLMYEPLDAVSTSPVSSVFEAKRSAIVSDRSSGLFLGIVGEYKKAVTRNFKLPEYASGFELQIDVLLQLAEEATPQYVPLSRYPGVSRDISLRVEESMTYAHVLQATETALGSGNLHTTVMPVGIYQPEGASTKNITFRIALTSYEKTLTNEEVNSFMDETAYQLRASIGAEVV